MPSFAPTPGILALQRALDSAPPAPPGVYPGVDPSMAPHVLGALDPNAFSRGPVHGARAPPPPAEPPVRDAFEGGLEGDDGGAIMQSLSCLAPLDDDEPPAQKQQSSTLLVPSAV